MRQAPIGVAVGVRERFIDRDRRANEADEIISRTERAMRCLGGGRSGTEDCNAKLPSRNPSDYPWVWLFDFGMIA